MDYVIRFVPHEGALWNVWGQVVKHYEDVDKALTSDMYQDILSMEGVRKPALLEKLLVFLHIGADEAPPLYRALLQHLFLAHHVPAGNRLHWGVRRQDDCF